MGRVSSRSVASSEGFMGLRCLTCLEVDVDVVESGAGGEAGDGHDVAGQRVQEARPH